MNELETMIIEYIENEDAIEDDYLALADAISHSKVEMKPTSVERRLLIATKFYVEATAKAEIRRYYQEMVKEVNLIRELRG